MGIQVRDSVGTRSGGEYCHSREVRGIIKAFPPQLSFPR